MHLLVAEGDYVVERFTASGTHRGEFMGAAPTNRTVAMPGINIFRLRDSKIVERREISMCSGSCPARRDPCAG
jgi:predicted ester cyclase